MMIRCRACGATIIPTAQFCGSCGRAVTPASLAPVPQPIYILPPPKSGVSAGWIVAGAALLLLLVVGTLLYRDMSWKKTPIPPSAPAVAAQTGGPAMQATPGVEAKPSKPAVELPPVQPSFVPVPPAPAIVPVAVGAGPSFSCARATTHVENLICGSERLSRLERQMTTLYAQIRSNRQLRRQVLVDQRLFLSILAQCGDEQCIEQLYLVRIDELSRY